jgi:hypothetical protein
VAPVRSVVIAGTATPAPFAGLPLVSVKAKSSRLASFTNVGSPVSSGSTQTSPMWLVGHWMDRRLKNRL